MSDPKVALTEQACVPHSSASEKLCVQYCAMLVEAFEKDVCVESPVLQHINKRQRQATEIPACGNPPELQYVVVEAKTTEWNTVTAECCAPCRGPKQTA